MARSFHYPKWMSMVNVVEMIGLKTTMLSQQKIAEDLKLEKHVTCRGVRPSPDLMEIEVFGDFWLSATKSELINNQSFWLISLKKSEFRQSVQESFNWNIAQPRLYTQSTVRWTCFRMGLHEGLSTTGWWPSHDWISNTCYLKQRQYVCIYIYICIYHNMHMTNVFAIEYIYIFIHILYTLLYMIMKYTYIYVYIEYIYGIVLGHVVGWFLPHGVTVSRPFMAIPGRRHSDLTPMRSAPGEPSPTMAMVGLGSLGISNISESCGISQNCACFGLKRA